MEPISIRYRMTESDFMGACGAHWSAHRQGTISNVITGIVGITIGLAMLFFIFWLALILAAVGCTLLLITGIRSFMWRRAFREAKKYNDDISIVIKDDAVHVESAEGKSELKWNFFTWYLDTPEHILLYMTKRSFSVIPKSAFQNQQRVQTFMDLVKTKLKQIR